MVKFTRNLVMLIRTLVMLTSPLVKLQQRPMVISTLRKLQQRSILKLTSTLRKLNLVMLTSPRFVLLTFQTQAPNSQMFLT